LICHGCIVKLPLSSCRRHVNCSVVVFTSCCFLVGNSTEREEGSVADTKATEALVPIVCHSPSSIGTVGGNGRQTRCVVARLGRDCGAIVFLSSLAPRFIQCVNSRFSFLSPEPSSGSHCCKTKVNRGRQAPPTSSYFWFTLPSSTPIARSIFRGFSASFLDTVWQRHWIGVQMN